MPLSDLTKLWTELTKIGHMFRKQSTLKIKVFTSLIYKSWSSQIFFTEKKIQKDSFGFWYRKMTFLKTLRMLFIIIILVGLKMTWLTEWMPIFNICKHSWMPNLIKKSWTVWVKVKFTKSLKVSNCKFFGRLTGKP